MLIAILIVVLAVLSFLSVLLFGKSCTLEFHVSDSEQVSVVYDTSILKCTSQQITGNTLFLDFTSLSPGTTDVEVMNLTEGLGKITRLYVHPTGIITIDTYIPIVLKLIVAFGLVFQMPLIIFVLGCFGMVTSQALREKRRIAIVVAFVLSMFLTPPDPMSQVVMAVPLCLLYEISIWAVWLREKGRFRR